MSDREQANENRETVSDILAEMRERADAMQTHGTTHGVRLAIREFVRRIKTARKRELAKVEADALAVGGIVEAARTAEKSSAVGNAAAMREALEAARDLLLPQCNGGTAFAKACGETVNKIMDALAAPARNCDLNLSAKSLWDKFEDYMHDCGLPFYSEPSGEDAFEWLIAPATKKGEFK